MNAKRIALAGMLAAVTLTAVSLTGCSKKTVDRLIPNLPPSVRLTAAPYDTSRATPYFYAYRMNWIADDPDGRIDYFLYTIDPPESATEPITWTRTQRNEQIVFFTADSSDAGTLIATRPHVFAICAIDNRGDTSQVVQRGFFSYTQAPTVTLASPSPNIFSPIYVTPSVRLQWNGNDPDGQLTSKPVKYKYILLGPGSTFPVDAAIASPANLRNYYAYDWVNRPGETGPWAGWDSTSADTNFVQFQNLTPDQTYLFVVIAFDEAGAFSPVFSFSQNMIRLRPGFASTLGPRITLYNESFFFQYTSGGWARTNEVKLEVPADEMINMFWTASPPEGSLIDSYRWMVDGEPEDDTTRERADDYAHWSEPSLNITNVQIGPFAPKTEHWFYVEALDNNGLRSLGVVHMTAVKATLERDLMVVFDVRLQIENGLPICPATGVGVPTGNWPNTAELDSFLFARGGVPWQCVTPAGNSDPGLFSGYNFDVYRTKTERLDKTVLLDTLGKYENIVWITDPNVALGDIGLRPYGGPYALKYMSGPGRVNTLATYVRQRGHVWIVGGGGAYALCKDLFDNASNNTVTFTYSNRLPTELQPGRFMYDVAHWRSELQQFPKADALIKRSSRADSIVSRGGWSMLTYEGFKTNPPYLELPAALEPKVAGEDPVPATRVNRVSTFLRPTSYVLEYLNQPNFILEDVDPDPVAVSERSTLDTLLRSEAALASGYIFEQGGRNPNGTFKPGTVIGAPIMTYYHGLENPPFVFSGHDLWNYRRSQTVKVVDFVLQRIFGLTKSGPLPAPAHVARTAPQVWTPGSDAARVADATRRAVPVGGASRQSPGSHE